MQAKPLYTLIAKEVTQDSRDNMLSIIKIIDSFNLEMDTKHMENNGVKLGEQPVLAPIQYSVATSWTLDSITKTKTVLTFNMRIEDNVGKNHGGPSQDHDVPVGTEKINVNFNVNGLPVSGSGNYKLITEVVTKQGKVIGSNEYGFTVNIK